MAFIEENRPAYLRRLAAMQAAIAPLVQAETSRKQQAAAVQAAETRARTDKLAQAGPGELFVLADEYKSQNDKAGARAALRALIKRFPDHALAKSAAAELMNGGD
jgi:TolA-binding protein